MSQVQFPPAVSRRLPAYILLAVFAGLLAGTPAAAKKPRRDLKEPPTYADVAYGSDPKQRFDVYCPAGKGPFPVLFWVHGGGWFTGDKIPDTTEPESYLKAGVAVVSINYRLIGNAVAEKILPPVTAVLGDARRALQYCRLHAAEWRLDPDKIVVAGGSAGAASALYLACEGEQANAASADPVERVSTKVLGAMAAIAQTSIDPEHTHEWNPGCDWGYWACEPPAENKGGNMDLFNKYLADRERWLPVIKSYSPEWLMTKETPPIYFSYSQPPPAPGTTPPSSALVHSPLWAIGFMKMAQEIGVKCYLQYPGHPVPEYKGGASEFILRELGVKE
jgi:acetyl esterase/lipase